ncbi:MAG: HD domain-containing protein [Bacteroidota bacterium]
MKQHKILNDPVYGFISLPYGLLYDLVEHPYFQRLRRIKQVSLTHLVYPGALHTRFHHALGALHLMSKAIEVLRSKGINITDDEAEAVQAAILMHDIGHGPFSHTLEHTLIEVHHEALSFYFMERLNEIFDGQLRLAIQIFKGEYPKKFLHQLVTGQLDMDRLDYLSRDSYFTGVSEGVVGYDRIIEMLNVVENRLVVEEKGIYSIERFLTSRRIMYWQVYLHKTVLAAEQMLIRVFERARELIQAGNILWAPDSLTFFLEKRMTLSDIDTNRDELLDRFAALDDTDIATALKAWQHDSDPLLSYLSWGLVNRRIFRLEFSDEPFEKGYVTMVRERLRQSRKLPAGAADYFLVQGQESNTAYNTSKEEIEIITKAGKVVPMSQLSDFGIRPKTFTKYFLCYPKEIGKL